MKLNNRNQQTLAQVEIQISRGHGEAIVRFDPKKLGLLDEFGISHQWLPHSEFIDVFKVSQSKEFN